MITMTKEDGVNYGARNLDFSSLVHEGIHIPFVHRTMLYSMKEIEQAWIATFSVNDEGQMEEFIKNLKIYAYGEDGIRQCKK